MLSDEELSLTKIVEPIGASSTVQKPRKNMKIWLSKWGRGYWGLGLLDLPAVSTFPGLQLSQGRNFFFLIPARTQLSAYANHEFKIIPIPTQLSAYANHELKNWCYIVKVTRR